MKKLTGEIVVILNPVAGRRSGTRRRNELEQKLVLCSAGTNLTWRIVETQRAGDGIALAAKAAQEGAVIVAAAGGDGTLNEVVNGLVGSGAVLGLVPLGTGNDFARCLGIGTELDRALLTLFRGIPRKIDLGLVNGRYFLNIAGCGFDAIVAERTNRGYRYLHGTMAYIAAIAEALVNLRPADLELTLDGEKRHARALMCSVANSTCYGGGMLIAPNAKVDDGLFDLCILAEAGRIEFLRAFPRVFRGTHTTHSKITMLRARAVAIVSDPPLPILIDGEVIGRTPVHFELHPGAMSVMAPEEATAFLSTTGS